MQRLSFDLPDGTLSALRFGGADARLSLVFCHANGFNAQSYRAILEPLGVAALSLDLRGHGLTNLPADPVGLVNWQVFADDLAYLFSNYIESSVVLAGHSYGAVAGILALPQIQGKAGRFIQTALPDRPGRMGLCPQLRHITRACPSLARMEPHI